MAADQSISLGIGFKVIDSLDEVDPGLGGDGGTDAATKLRMGVDPGSDRGSANWQFENRANSIPSSTKRLWVRSVWAAT